MLNNTATLIDERDAVTDTLITIVNPWCCVDRSTIRQIVGRHARLQFATDLWGVVDISPAPRSERLFVITSVADPRELHQVLFSIHLECSLDYVFLVGPQAGDHDAMSTLLAGVDTRLH